MELLAKMWASVAPLLLTAGVNRRNRWRKLREKHGILDQEADAARALLKEATDAEEKARLQGQVEHLERRRDVLAQAIAAREAELDK